MELFNEEACGKIITPEGGTKPCTPHIQQVCDYSEKLVGYTRSKSDKLGLLLWLNYLDLG
jgi:hypothetical protein